MSDLTEDLHAQIRMFGSSWNLEKQPGLAATPGQEK